ncbi:MAG: hypothetical protein ACOC5T_09860, partial [Elusimicrobiota bacterium]
RFSDWADKNEALAGFIVIVTAALGLLLLAIGPLLILLPTLVTSFGIVAGVLSGPVVVAILAVIAILGTLAFTLWWVFHDFEEFKKDMLFLWENIKREWNTIVSAITGFFKEEFEEIQTIVGWAVDWIKRKIDWVLEWVGKLEDAVGKVTGAIGKAGGWVGGQIQSGAGWLDKALGVEDAIITPQGKIISTHPDDYLIATKNPGGLSWGLIVNVTDNTLLDDEAGEKIGDMIVEKVKQNRNL